MSANLEIGILYLGSSGAGVKFTELLGEELAKYGKEFVLITRKNGLRDPRNLRVFEVKMPSLRTLAALGIGRRRTERQIIDVVRRFQIGTIIIPMAHPWDVRFQKNLQSQGVKIIRIIHDAKRHPGDIWPRNKDIKKLCNVDAIITLSRYTASLLENSEHKTIISCHPELKYGSFGSTSNNRVFGSEYDLIIGRQKKYQNTKTVVKWWAKLPEDIKGGRRLVVAGDVGTVTRLLLRGTRNVIFLDRWLTDAEFGNLVAHANRIICIYKEASQSGIVSAAQSRMVPVLVSDVGGLPEQIESFGGGLVTSLDSHFDWKTKYESLDQLEIRSNSHEMATAKFMNDVMQALDQVSRIS